MISILKGSFRYLSPGATGISGLHSRLTRGKASSRGETKYSALLQYFGHVMQRTDSMEKNLILERLKVGGEGDDRGWDGWMASATQWTWVWVNSGSWWWTGKPGVLQSRGSKRVGHGWAAELNWAPSLPVIIWSVIMDQDHKEFFLYGNLMWRHMVYLGETDNLEPPRSLSAFLIRVNSFHCGVWGNLMHPMFTVHSSIIYSCQDMESP